MSAAHSAVSAYELTLFVNGASELSARAIGHARQLCDAHLGAGAYDLSVVDVTDDDPAVVLTEAIVATPTLVRNRPRPVRRFVGDLADPDKVLLALELPVAGSAPASHR